jgi:pimeloyl-ACP methyl ester carboxylesterase
MQFLKQHQCLRTHWGDLAYYQRPGTGTPLLLLHGTGCESLDWADTVAHLPEEYHLVAIDFQGHGESDVPTHSLTLDDLARDTAALIDHLSMDGVVLAGHSLGGMVAMAAAERCDRVAGLVVLEGWTNLRAAEAFAPDRFYGNLSSEAVDRIQRKAQHTMDRFTPKAWQAFWESVLAFDGTEFLNHAQIPILEVYGEKGRLPETEKGLLVPATPWIDWTWVPDAGHYLPHERPRDVAQACLALAGRVHVR